MILYERILAFRDTDVFRLASDQTLASLAEAADFAKEWVAANEDTVLNWLTN